MADWIKQIAKYILSTELLKSENKIKELEATIFSAADEIIIYRSEIQKLKFPNPLEDYYNKKYPQTSRKYSKKFLNEEFSIDVRCFLGNYNNSELPTLKSDSEAKLVIDALKWVVKNLSYKSDALTTGLNEYWNFSFESIQKDVGDCEDGAILLYDILRKNGVPAWKLRINAGWAVNPWNGNTNGHAYLTYFSEEFSKWVALDWCYFPNIDEMKDQPVYKDISFYGDIWFSFNESFCWGKNKL
jgi:predicted transglutaminase-like cysteine proteinase